MKELSQELIQTLRAESKEAEANGRLTSKQLDIIHENRWFNLFVPIEYGGLAVSLPDAVRLEEQLASVDGSLGWVITLCAGANMFIGFLEEDLRKDIFHNSTEICFAGSGRTNGVAQPYDDGYIISGRWPYASGALHATHFTANCKVGDETFSFIFTAAEVTIHHDWNYLGLNATAGHSFSVDEVRVPANRKFSISAGLTKLNDVVYKYPFNQFAEATLAVNICGMSSYFFELLSELIKDKQLPNAECGNSESEINGDRAAELLALAKLEVEGLRKTFYRTLDQSWQSHINNVADATQLSRLTCESKRLARRSRELVDGLYPYSGMYGARNGTMINQVWRNIHTASQHAALL